jgi:Ca-activated chloride channel homolog
MLVFEHPEYLILLVVVPIVIFSHSVSLYRSKRRAILFSNYEAMKRVSGRHKLPKNITWIVFRILIAVLFTFAIAGTTLVYETDINEADYIIALDASTSMTSDDVTPTRFEAAKLAEINFINTLKESGTKSRVSLLTFAGTTFIHTPLTYDLGQLPYVVEEMNISYVPGTAIGEAIVNGANMLYQSDKVKIMYVITDGQSNVGIDIEYAIKYAQRNSMIVNTIGIGTVRDPLVEEDRLSSSLNPENLKHIASETGGKNYIVTDSKQLSQIFISSIQQTRGIYELDLTRYLLMSIFGLFVLEWILINTIFKMIP